MKEIFVKMPKKKTGYIRKDTHQATLPYVVVKGKNKKELKLLIDSGATNSYLNPATVSKDQQLKLEENFVIKTPIGSHKINSYVKDIELQEIAKGESFDFLLFHFHSWFDGLLVMDILIKLGASLHLENLVFRTKTGTVKVHLKPNRATDIHFLEEATKTIVTLPVSINNGSFLIQTTLVEEVLEITGRIYYARKGQAYLEVGNFTGKE